MQSSMIFLDCPPGERGTTMLMYYNVIIMKQGSRSIFCTGIVMIHYESVLFQRVATTCLRTGSLSCMDALCLSPRAPPDSPASTLLVAQSPLTNARPL